MWCYDIPAEITDRHAGEVVFACALTGCFMFAAAATARQVNCSLVIVALKRVLVPHPRAAYTLGIKCDPVDFDSPVANRPFAWESSLPKPLRRLLGSAKQ